VVKIRGIQVHGEARAEVTAGHRAALNLGGVDTDQIARGQTLAAADTVSVTRRVDVELELLPGARPIRHGARLRVHHGTAEVLARVSLAGPDALMAPAGGRAPARLRLESPAVLTRGDRLILRSYSPALTIGAATVLDPAPVAPGIRSAAALERLAALGGADGHEALKAMIRDRGLRGVPVTDAVARAGLAPSEVGHAIDGLAPAVVRAGERLVAADALERAAQSVVALIRAFHLEQPISEGLPREEARARAFKGVDPAIFDAAMRRLVAAGAVIDRERLALPSHKASLPGGEATVARVEDAYRAAGLTPPDRAAIAQQAGVAIEAADAATTYLVRQKTLARLDTLVVHRDALDGLKRDMVALKAAGAGNTVRLDVTAFKDRYGITRKYAIPLLEYLDRERVTRRVGDQRVLL
jgi:selenocysteine-specific elongation factor